MDDVKDLLTLDKCRVAGGRSQISTTFSERTKVDKSVTTGVSFFLWTDRERLDLKQAT